MSRADDDIRNAVPWFLTVREGDGFKAIAVWQITGPMVENGVKSVIRASTLDELREAAEESLGRARQVIEAQRASGNPDAHLHPARH